MSLYHELKRRNVFKVAAAYIIIAWLIMQVGEVMAPALHLPEWVDSLLAFFLILGFPLALFFAWAFELTPEGLKKEKDVVRDESISHLTGRRLDFAIIALLALALAYFAWDELRDLGKAEESGLATPTDSPPDPATAKAEGEPSIAVLPFVNMSPDPEQEFFSDGITEEILNVLAGVPALKVAGRTSSFAFKGRNEDLRAIGDALGVDHILEGSVRKAGERIRVTAQLVQAENGFHLWSETWDRELTDIFAIQDEIAAAILEQMQARLGSGNAVRVAPVDLAVYDQYLQARQKIRERNEASLMQAIGLLDQVIAADPGYAPAHAQRAVATLLAADWVGSYGSIPLESALEEAARHEAEALRLDPDNAEALAARGLRMMQLNRNEDAVRDLRRALALNPNMLDASNWLQNTLGALGRLDEALQITEQMHQRDPLYVPALFNLVLQYHQRGDSRRAETLLERVRPVVPEENRGWLAEMQGYNHFSRGEYAQAVQAWNRAAPLRSMILRMTAAYCWWMLQAEDQAWQRAEDTPFAILILARQGRVEEALMRSRTLMDRGQGVQEYLRVLYENGRAEELVQFVEQRWPDLASFEKEVPRLGFFGPDELGRIAWAYRSVGNMVRYGEATERHGRAIDELVDQGLDFALLTWSKAMNAVLRDDHDAALDHLEAFLDQGGLEFPDFWRYWQGFDVLRGDPRFEAIVARLVERIDSERAQLDLPPLEQAQG